MENLETQIHDEQSLFINPEIKGYLLETSRWGKILAIVGYVGIGLIVLLALAMLLGASLFNKVIPGFPMGFPMGFMAVPYLLFALLYYFPVNYLHRYSKKIKRGLQSKELDTVTVAFRNLKSLFKFMGILMLVVLSIYAVVLVIMVPMALFFKSGLTGF